MMELWADALSARRGYDREACRAMVRQTVAGTVSLEEQDGIDAREVIRRVAHPGGSTERGLTVIDRLFPAMAEEMLRAVVAYAPLGPASAQWVWMMRQPSRSRR